ncbi:hypothetical protein [Nonomuraea sp. NPDC003201]
MLKPDATRILHSITADDVSYVFDDSITAIGQDEDGVSVEFERAAGGRFDLVIGADGVYSNVRRHVFGPHRGFVQHLDMSGVGYTSWGSTTRACCTARPAGPSTCSAPATPTG